MKKKLAIVLTFTTLLLAACGGSEPATEAPSAEAIQESVVKEEPKESTEEKASVVEEQTIGITEGPFYAIGTLETEAYVEGYDEGPAYTGFAQTIDVFGPQYAKLRQALEEYNRNAIESIHNQDTTNLIDEDMDLEYAYFPWSDETYVAVMRSDSKIFAFMEDSYSYYGGAHGMYGSYPYVFSTETGNKLAIGDLVTDYDKLYETVEGILSDYEEDLYNNWTDILYESFYGSQSYFCWIPLADEIQIWFNPYEIAPYASGMIFVDITLEEHPELLLPEYFYPIDETLPENPSWAKMYEGIPSLVMNQFVDLSNQVGYMEYDQVYSVLKDLGYDMEAYEPAYGDEEELEDGAIYLYDPANNLQLCCYFESDFEMDETEVIYSRLASVQISTDEWLISTTYVEDENGDVNFRNLYVNWDEDAFRNYDSTEEVILMAYSRS